MEERQCTIIVSISVLKLRVWRSVLCASAQHFDREKMAEKLHRQRKSPKHHCFGDFSFLAAGEGFELPRRDVICCPLLLSNPRNARMIGRFQSSDYYDILACVSQSRRGKGMNKDMNDYLIIFEEIC